MIMEEYDQMGIFEATYEPYRITKPIRLIELFGGIGSQCKAFEILGADFESHRVCEWSVNSIIAYNAIHVKDWNDYSEGLTKEELIERVRGVSADYNQPMTDDQLRKKPESWLRRLYSSMVAIRDLKPDVSTVHAEDLGITEKDRYEYVMTYSFPCFTGDQMVLTEEFGYVPFRDLWLGMRVLAKDGKWHAITGFMEQGRKKTCWLTVRQSDPIHTTPNHRFLIRTKGKGGLGEPRWKEAKDLAKGDWLGIPCITEEKPFFSDSEAFWEMMGHYVGDGWVNSHCKDVRISCDERKLARVSELAESLGIRFTVNQTSEHCWNLRFSNKAISDFALSAFGSGADRKTIPTDVIKMPRELLEAFLKGWSDADGYICHGKRTIATTSRSLAYSVALIVNKIYHKACSVYAIKPSQTKTIVRQKTWYQARWSEGRAKQSAFEDGYVWFPFRSLKEGKTEEVYDIEVEGEHSFVVQGCLAHNCQDLSLAGLGKGMSRESGTRSEMLWQVERILLELSKKGQLPQILVMENVPQVHTGDNIEPFNDWLQTLQKLGYTSYDKDLNAKKIRDTAEQEQMLHGVHLGRELIYVPGSHQAEA